MKYFTKEELDNIANSLLENPTPETLKKLSEQYNIGDQIIADQTQEMVASDINNPVGDNTVNQVVMETTMPTEVTDPIPDANMQFNVVTGPEVVNPVDNNLQSFDPNLNMGATNFQIPTVEPPVVENNNLSNLNTVNEVPFNGNLWDNQMLNINGMMQPTDNFTSPNVMPSIDPSVPNNQNVNLNNEQINNNPNNVQQEPTMFGQFEQNYNNVA